MTELQNISLLYESSVLLVEDAKARVKYLWNKYGETWSHAATILHLGGDGDAGNYHISLESWMSRANPTFHAIVNRLDPTQGKYSEWFVQLMMKAAKSKDVNLFDDLYKYARGSEDTYKVREALEVYDKFKHKLDVSQRDINKLTLQQLFDITEPFTAAERELSQKELARKIKGEETIKLVDGLLGWTVVMPLTKLSARYYGANTKWCTAARNDEDNAFDSYYKDGPLFIFINGDTKFQWHVEVNAAWERLHGEVDPDDDDDEEDMYSDSIDPWVQFMNAFDIPARYSAIPYEVWEATYESKAIKGRFQVDDDDEDGYEKRLQVSRALTLMDDWHQQMYKN